MRRTRHEPDFEVIRIVGKRWEPRSHRLRDILDRSRVPYGFYDSDSEEAKQAVFAAGDVRHRSAKRVVSAVGEGATAIQLVHEYLRSG